MAIATFTGLMNAANGSVNAGTQINKNQNRWTVELTKSPATINGTIVSVTGTFTFSVIGYGTTYTVTASLCKTNELGETPVASATRTDIKLTSNNYTRATFEFSFNGLTIDDINAIKYIHFTSPTSTTSATGSATEIYCKDYQTLTIKYEEGTIAHTISYHNGTEWVECEVYYHDGTNWVLVDPYYHNGTEWVLCDSSG